MKEKKILFQELSIPTINNPTHNPFPPIQVPIGPSIERPVCSFYSKTGVCRYNERFVLFFLISCFDHLFSSSCHRTHNKPDITNTLLAVNMYSNFEMQYGLDEEYDLGRKLLFN
jgi:hypothetical protein